jgi:hypothetical protein
LSRAQLLQIGGGLAEDRQRVVSSAQEARLPGSATPEDHLMPFGSNTIQVRRNIEVDRILIRPDAEAVLD